MKDDEVTKLAMKSGLVRCLIEWMPSLRDFASLVQSAERERCAQYLRESAKGLPPYTANVLACKGDELAAGCAWLDVGDGEKK